MSARAATAAHAVLEAIFPGALAAGADRIYDRWWRAAAPDERDRAIRTGTIFALAYRTADTIARDHGTT